MNDLSKKTTTITIEEELKQSYLSYAMSVIVGRALPDVRDGLKPVHRRVLYAMKELGNDFNKPHKKSARVVGDVIGKYHPHGDTAVYDTIVRMAQPFSLRYLLIDGQGNFGSVDGDSAAAMRYTEVRMSKLAHSLLADLEKETVDFQPNYDGTETLPVVLPTRIPNLLVNGSSGIAVGMATNIPPHNLNEVVDAALALIRDPDLSIPALMEWIKGPDFPTAGIIYGYVGIEEAYLTGRGKIYIRAKTNIEREEGGQKENIIITELPYQVNKARLIEKIAELVKEKRIEGITGLRDESDKDGMRVVIELRRGENAEVVLNNLYSLTQLQTVFGINMVALSGGQPRTFNLKEMLEAFLAHRREVVTRRTLYELKKARERAHLLEGLAVALANIETIIELIKQAPNPAKAKQGLMSALWQLGELMPLLNQATAQGLNENNSEWGLMEGGYRLSEAQAQAILDLRLHRLTGLEQNKIREEYISLLKSIDIYLDILTNPNSLRTLIIEELNAVKADFGDSRRTEIVVNEADLCIEDLIPREERVVTLSNEGYVKTQSLDTYQAQHRGGRGKSATQMKEEDVISTLLVANSHDTLLCFSNMGKVYWLKVYKLPQASRESRGKPIVNLLPLAEKEQINAVLAVKDFSEERYVFMATVRGTVKKTALSEFSRPRANGIIALHLDEKDYLIGSVLTQGDQDIMLFSDAGKVIRFPENAVRAVGRTARGVRGIRLSENQSLIALIAVSTDEKAILTATENGYGKRTSIKEYRLTGRGGQGVISIQVNERNGAVVGACAVDQEDEMVLISQNGTLVRIPVAQISLVGRNTQGVRLIRLDEADKLVAIQGVAELKIDSVLAEAEQ